MSCPRGLRFDGRDDRRQFLRVRKIVRYPLETLKWKARFVNHEAYHSANINPIQSIT
jgi:hypothetical protein